MEETRRGFLKAAATAAGAVGAAGPAPGLAQGQEHQVIPSDLTLRVKSLESLLVDKGLVDRKALDALIDTYEHKVGPRNGARVVARAWSDPAYKQRLLTDADAALAELGYGGLQGEHMVVVENTPMLHNMVVCTLCSCYPWPVLGLPPVWYKSAPYRSRSVIDPRGVLKEFGLELSDEVEVRVWDSTAELRYLVLPERPAGTEGLSEDALAAPGDARFDDWRRQGCSVTGRSGGMNSVHDMGGMHGFGPIRPEKNEPVFHARWEGRVFALNRAVGAWGKWNIDASRHEKERIPPAEYLRSRYFEKFLVSMTELLIASGLVTREEVESGKPARGSTRATPAAYGRQSSAARCEGRAREPRHARRTDVSGGSARARPQHQSHRPYTLAALRARQVRHDRTRPWRVRVPRHQRPLPWREAAACVLGPVRGA